MHWHSILKHHWTIREGRPQGQIYFGQDRYHQLNVLWIHGHQSYPLSELGPPAYPHIQFGPLVLTRHGEFKFNYRMHGAHQRNIIARNTFLDWGHVASRYQWFINTGDLTSKWNFSVLTAWRNPVHYVRESLLAPSAYTVPPYWLKVVHDPNYVGNWRIAFSRMSELPRHNYHLDVDVPAMFEHNDAIQAKRRRLLRDEELVNSGQLVLSGGRMRPSAEVEKRREAQALHLAAHLDVRMPAKTTPLKRPSEKEVPDGHDVDAHDPNGAPALAPE